MMLSNPIEYWENRHKHLKEWTSGGDRTLSGQRNKAFYLHRLGLLLGLLDFYCNSDELDILDAGCGKGWLTDQLTGLGHIVTGADSSESAIEICKDHRNGKFILSKLSELSTGTLFDAVICMDVLFHILADAEWKYSLINLASLITADGILVVADDPRQDRYTLGDYIVHRTMAEYIAVLKEVDFVFIEELPYRFAGNPNKFLVFKRG